MRPLAALIGALLPLACNDAGFDAVLIRPMYGWADGCTSVTVTGRGFGDNPTATIGGNALENVTYPETTSLDYGFALYGTTPSNGTGEKGWADVTVTNGDGETDTIKEVYYYVACPAGGYLESASPGDGVTAGDTITLSGCNIDASLYTIKVGGAGPSSLTSTCGTASATFAAPAVSADGAWYVGVYDSTGTTQVWPDPTVCDTTLPVGTYAPEDTADTGWVDPCSGVPYLTYGGAR